MRVLFAVVALLIVAPVQAQVTPDSVRAALERIDLEAGRSLGFIRAAETQALKVRAETAAVLALLDSLIAAGLVVDTVTPGPADTTTPPPQPDTTTPPPPQSGDFRRNLPAGWTVVSDYGFDEPPPSPGAYYENQAIGASGWLAQDWSDGRYNMTRAADANAPDGDGYVLEETYPPGLSGGGTTTFYRSIPAADQVYISWIVKWEAGFDHNNTSEKQIHFNLGSGTYPLFQFHWGVESLYGVRDAAGACCLYANQLPQRAGDRMHDAPPVDGQWVEYEILFDRSTGTVKWWLDGVLHASYTGRSLPAIHHIKFDTTWGGGGNKQGTHRRWTDHVTVARGG